MVILIFLRRRNSLKLMTQRLELSQSAEKEFNGTTEQGGKNEEKQAERPGEIQPIGVDGIMCAETTQFLRARARG